MTDNRPRLTLHSLLENTDRIPTLNRIYQRLEQKINDPSTSMEDIAQLIGEDPGLTTTVLKLVNSPMFGYQQEISSISRALVLIGTHQLSNLALGVSVMSSLTDIPRHLLQLEQFWRHSIACAILARKLAQLRGMKNPETYFLLGMLHDLGLLTHCLIAPATAAEVLQRQHREGSCLQEIEQRCFGFDHAATGGALLSYWHLADEMAEPVTCHHNPAAAIHYPLETAFISIADLIAHSMGIPATAASPVPPLHEPCWEQLGLETQQLPALITAARNEIAEVGEILLST